MAVAYQTIKGASGLYVPVGMIMSWTKASTPTGFLVCDGSAISRTTYAALFDAIGTTHGVGDGSTTFNLPDLQGRLPVGDDGGVSYTVAGTGGNVNVSPSVTDNIAVADNIAVNKTGGASGSLNGAPDAGTLAVSVSGNVTVADTTLSTSSMPSHTHQQRSMVLGGLNSNAPSSTAYNANVTYGNGATTTQSGGSSGTIVSTNSTGSGGAHGHGSNHNLSGTMNGAPGLGTLGVTINDNIAVVKSGNVSKSGSVSVADIDTRSPYVVIRYVIKF